jgi:hypothetical protein
MLLDVIINMLPRILIYLFHVLESFVSKDLINFLGGPGVWTHGLVLTIYMLYYLSNVHSAFYF